MDRDSRPTGFSFSWAYIVWMSRQKKRLLTWGFLLCWLTNIYWSFGSLITCIPGWTNKAELQNIISTALTLLSSSSGWRITEYQHSRKLPLFGICNPEAVSADLKSANANSNLFGMAKTEQQSKKCVFVSLTNCNTMQTAHSKFLYRPYFNPLYKCY